MAGQQPVIIWLNAALMALTFTAICARVGRRVFVVGQFSWHDALITLAAVAAFTFSIFQIACTSLGLGLHQKDIAEENIPTLVKLTMASNVFYFLCNWAVKHALLLFYSDISREKKYHRSIWFMHFIAFGFGSSSILVNIFQCRPFSKAWNGALPGFCANMSIFFYCNASIMLATDIVLYAMPVAFTWHLQLRRTQRIGLNCLFALGGIVLAASAARLYAVDQLATKPDFFWWFANAMIWSVLENHLAIVVACAPSVKVIALLVFPRLRSSISSLFSKVSNPNSRSRSRAFTPSPFNTDLENGDRKSGTSDKGSLKAMDNSTPLPSPAITAGSGRSRASRNFAKWFRRPSQAHLTSSDSLEDDHGLVYIEDIHNPKSPNLQLSELSKDGGSVDDKRASARAMSPIQPGENDIRVERTITVEGLRISESSEDDVDIVGRAC